MRNVPLVFVDTETTGLSFNRQTWEVAMVRDEPNGDTQRIEFMLPIFDASRMNGNPKNWTPLLGTEMNEKSLEISKFHERHPSGRQTRGAVVDAELLADYDNKLMPLAKAAAEIYRMTYGAHFIGMVPEFDSFNLWRILISQGIDNFPWYYQTIDVDILSAGNDIGYNNYCDKGAIPYPNLSYDTDAATKRHDVTIDEKDRHTAMGDTLWTREFYYSIVGGEIPGV